MSRTLRVATNERASENANSPKNKRIKNRVPFQLKQRAFQAKLAEWILRLCFQTKFSSPEQKIRNDWLQEIYIFRLAVGKCFSNGIQRTDCVAPSKLPRYKSDSTTVTPQKSSRGGSVGRTITAHDPEWQYSFSIPFENMSTGDSKTTGGAATPLGRAFGVAPVSID